MGNLRYNAVQTPKLVAYMQQPSVMGALASGCARIPPTQTIWQSKLPAAVAQDPEPLTVGARYHCRFTQPNGFRLAEYEMRQSVS
jgi:hypothetical protein